ncbi:MAG: ribosome small subunit-dependent GTPase A [Opitutaceae bacterium]|jgi:ribosome biogenesis GTPase|nr:ribosome small subunit-dependent GTPase A [Opitutaceae bacterium]
MNDDSPTLREFGWDAPRAVAFAPYLKKGYEPARVVVELRRHYYAVQTSGAELLGECTGRFHHQAATAVAASANAGYPAVGDWVAVSRLPDGRRAHIHALLPRRTVFSRRAAGEEEAEQIIAANIDTVFLVSGLDRNHNPARIQRFLVAAKESGAEPVIILNKCDLLANPGAANAARKEIEALLPGVPVLVTSAGTGKGLRILQRYARPGRTLAFVGSSGVGKSSLINALACDAGNEDADALPTADVREKDSKGRHTTTRRELVVSRSGALVIDTPGLRELRLRDADAGLEEAFADIAALAVRCKFGRCRHENEPGCAVRAAIETGALVLERLAAWRKLKAEQAAARPRQKKPSALAGKPGWRRRAAEGDRPARGRRDWTAEFSPRPPPPLPLCRASCRSSG